MFCVKLVNSYTVIPYMASHPE